MFEELIANMTLEEKIALCSGADSWQTKAFKKYGIPAMFMCDGPHGLRKQEKNGNLLGINESRSATCFPAEVTTASSWDISMLERIGQAVAEEAKNQKVGLVLGPGANIKRNPLCGRNFEYFSEDPFLAGKLAAAFIRGAEGEGVGTSLKHFACNQQEKDRMVSDGVIDERTLREIYLTGFEIAVNEGNPATIMCSYPKINGVHASDNKKLLTDILRNEWGYNGVVITDWGAMNDRIEGFKAGCDLNMPGGAAYMENDCLQAVKEGRLTSEEIDKCALRVIKLVNHGIQAMTGEECDYNEHHSLCEEVAISGAVLLKNDDSFLPLKEDSNVLIVGYMAKDMRYQGAGSSHINSTRLSQPLDSFAECEYAQGCDESGGTTNEYIEEISVKAKKADAVVVFAGLPGKYESEGFDRDNMKMPEGHIRMINAAAEANTNTVVVLMCGSAVECPWADNVKSILFAGLPGQAGGEAIRKLLYGGAVPSGKLAESWPFEYENVPSSEIYGKTKDALYEEGIYVGYRYYDKAGIPVRFPFGFGLSYTTFEYSNMFISDDKISVTVTNTGEFDAAEVVQLYIATPQDGLHRPIRELKGFEKIFLTKGESKKVTFALDDRCFRVFSDGWKVPSGEYSVCIGSLSTTVDIDGTSIEIPEWQADSFYDKCEGKPDRLQWEKMMGKKYIAPVRSSKRKYTMENSVIEMKEDSLIMKLLFRAIELLLIKTYGTKHRNDPEFKMMMACSAGAPFRSLYISSGVKGGIFPGLLEMANGHFLKGFVRIFKR